MFKVTHFYKHKLGLGCCTSRIWVCNSTTDELDSKSLTLKCSYVLTHPKIDKTNKNMYLFSI